ncbi:photoreceptor disk component PRCD isoform X1 [Neofelis nebulosa]|uniref:photoreceptor disk component PRCD isoform X1 n=1 Tax=Neofelis nebulosa TaxID=61452 RepID=UPI00272BBCD0|nr:photoreceptor disk component PRCD isoform X1 [Neofelis nebulosa]XP_058558987.1 photoreceptor disk component PRCD isoform X1 [Neofelis nebulosa]
MCTTLFLLSTLAMLWRRRFANRVQPEPSGLDGAVVGSNVDTDLQSSGSTYREPATYTPCGRCQR